MKFLINVVDPINCIFYQNHSVKYKEDSGLDLFVISDETIPAGETRLIDLGIKAQLRSFDFMKFKYVYHSYFLFPRSSIYKTPLRLANSIGLIDAGYLGNIKAPLHNISSEDFHIKRGERYLQLSCPNLGRIKFDLTEELRQTDRSNGGFGSTGK